MVCADWDVWVVWDDCDEDAVVWEFTGVAVTERTGWTEIGGLGLDGFELIKSDWTEFTTFFCPEDEVLVDDVTAMEEVEDADDEEVEIEACPWLWLMPDTELVTVEVDGIFELPLLVWYYAWVYVVTVLRLVKFPWRILFWK